MRFPGVESEAGDGGGMVSDFSFFLVPSNRWTCLPTAQASTWSCRRETGGVLHPFIAPKETRCRAASAARRRKRPSSPPATKPGRGVGRERQDGAVMCLDVCASRCRREGARRRVPSPRAKAQVAPPRLEGGGDHEGAEVVRDAAGLLQDVVRETVWAMPGRAMPGRAMPVGDMPVGAHAGQSRLAGSRSRGGAAGGRGCGR